MSHFSVETIAGCTVLRGSVPIPQFTALAKTLPRNAVLDLGAASRMGASFVMGTQEQLNALRAMNLPAGPQVQEDLAKARAAGLSSEATAWLDGYDRGNSSNSLFAATTGVRVSGSGAHIPLDAADLQRCVMLVHQVPEVRSNLCKAGVLSASWKKLADNWAEFERLLAGSDRAELRAALKGLEGTLCG